MSPLWITYAWKDDDEGDFSYLVQQLAENGVEAIYDKVALVPGGRLWEQIADKISEGELSGWAYLITPASLASEACREELAYALDRVLRAKGSDFPLIGLVHGVRSADVPAPLRTRVYVNLENPDWKDEVKAAIEQRPPVRPTQQQTKYVWNMHEPYQGDPSLIAFEVRPRFGQVLHWRFAVPDDAEIVTWGNGATGGAAQTVRSREVVEGHLNSPIDGHQMKMVGCGDTISPSVSAYLVVSQPSPPIVAFAENPTITGGLMNWEIISRR